MIITHLALEGVGRFRTRHAVRGLGPGLNLLCAPNEAGKSTIARALRACLFYRHTSTDKEISTLACLGAQLAAVIEVGFEQRDAGYTIRKSFLSNRNSKLFKSGQLAAEGREADEEVWSALGLAAGTRSANESAFGMLWVRQGAQLDALDPDDARSVMTRLIEAEVGQVLGGARGERVRERVGNQLGDEETKNGQPKTGGRWKAAKDAVDAARDKLEAVSRTLALLDADLKNLVERMDERRRLDDPAALARLRADLEAARQAVTEADRAQGEAQAADNEAARLQLAAEIAERKHRDLVEIDLRITGSRQRLADIDGQIATAESARAARANKVQEAEAEDADLAARLASINAAWGRTAKIFDAITDVARIDDIKAKLTRARAIRQSLAAIAATLSHQGVSAEAMRAVDACARAFAEKQAQIDAKAPHVSIHLTTQAGKRVRFRGEVLEASMEAPVTEPVHIDIDGIASIEIAPVSVPADMQAVEAARKALQDALRAARADTIEDARERRTRTEDGEAERRGLTTELTLIAPEKTGGDGVAALEAELAAIESNLDSMKDYLPGALPTATELNQRRADAEKMREACRLKCIQAHDVLVAARYELAAEDVRLSALRAQKKTDEVTLRDDLARAPDVQRPDQLAALSAEAVEARGAVMLANMHAEKLRAALPSEVERAALHARAMRLQGATEAQRSELERADRDIIALRERIITRGGDGLGERKVALEDELAVCERELARIERRLDALRLLRETIDACRDEARDAYLAPIMTAMRPYLHSLFPNAEAHLDENLSIEGLSRGAADAEPFDYLSHGTREQMAVVVRLGLGRLLADRDQPVPILLDDALVFADDERIERMFDALTLAAEKQQVIVFTCRSRAFQSMGGRRLRIEPEGAAA